MKKTLSPGDHVLLESLIYATIEFLDENEASFIEDEERDKIDKGKEPKTVHGEAYWLSCAWAKFREEKLSTAPPPLLREIWK